MDFNTFVNGLSWKKIIVIGLGLIVGIWIIKELIFWCYFHEAERVFAKLNTQITEQQKDIQKKLADSVQEFNVRSKKMDDESDDFDKSFRKQQKEMMDYLDRVEIEDEARNAAFDKAFREAPAKMWAEHEKFGDEMRKDYLKQSHEMSENFNKRLINIGKTLERDRCRIALNKVFEKKLSSNLPPVQLKNQNDTIKAMQKSIAKKEHCEAYL